MLKLNVGVSRKIGLPDYSSAGAICHIEVECDQRLLEQSPEEFQARIRSAYAAARQAVEAELARHLGPPSSGSNAPVSNGQASPIAGPTADPDRGQPDPRPNGRTHPGRGRSGSSWSGSPRPGRGRQPASAKQVKAIYAIARAGGADLEGLLRDDYGVGRPEELTLAQASRLIDQLQAAADA